MRRRQRHLLLTALLLAMTPGLLHASDEEPTKPLSPPLVLRPIRADQQLQRLLNLFQGARAPHPAAALASWREATGRHDGLSKLSQALLAFLNPQMVHELTLLEGAQAALDPTPQGGLLWWLDIPADDGTFAAIGTALALTDGLADTPLGTASVDRLGPPGSPLLAHRADGGVALASDRETLARALDHQNQNEARKPLSPFLLESGWNASLNLQALPVPAATSTSTSTFLRVAHALRQNGCQSIILDAGLVEPEALQGIVTSHFREPTTRPGPVLSLKPEWLDWIPSDHASAAIALALDPNDQAAWNRAFALADAIEKLDPARARAGPLRSRLNLAALAAGVWPEAELYPQLVGLTAIVRINPLRQLESAALVLHARSPEAARRLVERVFKPLLRPFLSDLSPPGADPATDGPPALLGRLAGHPLEATLRESSLLLSWGQNAATACLQARDNPQLSAASLLRQNWPTANDEPSPRRLGIAWPGRLALAPSPGPLADTLSQAPPILWKGTLTDPNTTRDLFTWSPLSPSVRAFLERIPLAPPPSGAAP